MTDTNKRKRDGSPPTPEEGNTRPSKRPKCGPADIPGEAILSSHEASTSAHTDVGDVGEGSSRVLTEAEQNRGEVTSGVTTDSRQEQDPGQEDVAKGSAWDNMPGVSHEQKQPHTPKDDDNSFQDVHPNDPPVASSCVISPEETGSTSGEVHPNNTQSVGRDSCVESEEEMVGGANIEEAAGSSVASMDTVDMEAAHALTFLKQSASPTKSIATSSTRESEGSPTTTKSTATLYTGSIRRKGFAKSSLAKQHLQKSTMKKLVPTRCSGDTDSDSQQDSPSSTVSPQRMVIDLQPTRKSARQAAKEVKEKPWSMMMKRGKRTRLENKFDKQKSSKAGSEDGLGQGQTKLTRGRKKGTKGPSLDADEMALAREACDILEKRLEENAAKNNLSVVNVKNILHHVITNEHVLAMVHNTMGEESISEEVKASVPSGSKPAVYEPKMTRAKLKEVSEKSGKVPFVWPVSPVKKPKPQFTDLNFSDSDDSDDDYKPSQEDLLKDESDYESTTSFGSPCPSTPRSSLNTSLLEDLEEEEEEEEEEDVDEEAEVEKVAPASPPPPSPASAISSSPAKAHLRAVAVPMGPPPPRSRLDRLKDDAKFLKELDEVNQELEKSEDTIAHRTRSKCTIDTTLEEIEASFVAPDITADMFDTRDDCGEDNEEWVRWLAGLYHGSKDPEVSDLGEDDQNDPEYNFLAEEEALDEEDFRNDKTVQISKKEVNELLDELIDAYENEDWAADFDMQHFDRPPQLTLSDMIAAQRQMVSPKEPVKVKKLKSPQQQQQQQQQPGLVFTHDERLQLQQQMQQHVQLLSQMHVLCRGSSALEPHMDQAELFLNELDMLGGRSESVSGVTLLPAVGSQQSLYHCSAFRPCNLAGALQVIKQQFTITDKEIASMKANDSWRTNINDGVRRKNQVSRSPPTEGAQEIIAHSKVFMYSELLPLYSLTHKKLEKTIFEKAEDNLITLGLMQFPVDDDRQAQYRMIVQNMVPIKTSRQIYVHIKNVCCKQNSLNVIKNWRKHGILPTLIAPCVPVIPGTEKAPVDQYQLYDMKPEWLKKYQSSFYPQPSRVISSPFEPALEAPASQQELNRIPDTTGKTTPVPSSRRVPDKMVSTPTLKDIPSKTLYKSHTQSFSKLEPLVPSLGLEGHLRVRMFPKIAPKPSDSKNMNTSETGEMSPSVLVINPQQGTINAISGSTVQIISTSGGFAISQQKDPQVLINPTSPAVTTIVNPTAATTGSPSASMLNPMAVTTSSPSTSILNPTAANTGSPSTSMLNPMAATTGSPSTSMLNPTAATTFDPTDVTNLNPSAVFIDRSPVSHPATPGSTPNHSPRVSPTISPSGISALQNFKVQHVKRVPDCSHLDPAVTKVERTKHLPSKTPKSKEISRQSGKKKKIISLNERGDAAVSEKTSTLSNQTPPPVIKKLFSTSQSPQNTNDGIVGFEKQKNTVEEDSNPPGETSRPPSRSKSNTPDSVLDEEGLEEFSPECAVPSPGENALENVDSNCQDSIDPDILQDAHPSRGLDISKKAVVKEKASSLTTKMAAKRMKTKLRRDLESTVVLLDSDIMSKDPKREERETSFSRAYLNKVKERFLTDPEKYVEFLGIFNSFSQSPELPVDELYQEICQSLEGHPDLIEDFTAFLPPDVAVECGVLMENLEYAKARLFLRQVEVHFQKNPAQFQKVLGAIRDWGSKEERSYNELKENLLPLLKGQPHLEQEFSLLFPDDRPPDNYMMDFEEIIWDDDKDKEYDSFEEIEIPDSDEEIPITKSRVGRPPNKPPSGTQTPSGLKASAMHGLLPKTALLKGKLPTVLKSPAGKKSTARLKSQAIDPWQELNTRLQYGTQGCKCNCHEKSHDSRVQRKVRHCAYCSAMVTRTELISSLRGFTMGNRRRGHLLTVSKQPDTSEDDDSAQGIRAKRGSGRSLTGRKSQKVHWASTEDGDQDVEEEEDEEEENPYSDAVAHLSEICSNLADYLNENASEEEEEEEKEMDIDDDDEGNDDGQDGQDDDDFEDLEEDEEDPDEKPEDDEEEDEAGDDAVITSEESRGLEGTATPDSTFSSIQATQMSCPSEGSSESKPSLPPPAQLGSSSQTTLLGSGVIEEGSGSRANSPVMYSEDNQSTEDHMRQLKKCLSQDRGDSGSNPSSVQSLICDETLSNSPVKHFSAIPKSAKSAHQLDRTTATEKPDPTHSSASDIVGTSTEISSHSSQSGTGQRLTQRRPSETQRPIRRIKTVRPTRIPKVPFGQSERIPLFESLAKCMPSSRDIRTPEPAQETSEEQATITNFVQYVKQSSDYEAESPRRQERTPKRQSSGSQSPGSHFSGSQSPRKQFPGGRSPGSQSSGSHSSGRQSPGRQSPGRQFPGRQSPGKQSPGRQSPGRQSSGRQSPGSQSPGSQSSGRQSPGRQSPGRQSPGRQSSGRQSSGRQSPGHQSPGRQFLGGRSPGSQSPGRQSPGSQSPGRQSPRRQSPGSQSPGRHSLERDDHASHSTGMHSATLHSSGMLSPSSQCPEHHSPRRNSPERQSFEWHSSDATDLAQTSTLAAGIEAGDFRADESHEAGSPEAEMEKEGEPSLLPAANIARMKDGEVVVVWTRDEDRLLLQQCRDQGATPDVFEQVASTLNDKNAQQVEDRFTTLMKLFQSSTQEEEEEEEDEEEEATSDDEEDV